MGSEVVLWRSDPKIEVKENVLDGAAFVLVHRDS